MPYTFSDLIKVVTCTWLLWQNWEWHEIELFIFGCLLFRTATPGWKPMNKSLIIFQMFESFKSIWLICTCRNLLCTNLSLIWKIALFCPYTRLSADGKPALIRTEIWNNVILMQNSSHCKQKLLLCEYKQSQKVPYWLCMTIMQFWQNIDQDEVESGTPTLPKFPPAKNSSSFRGEFPPSVMHLYPGVSI